MPRLRVLTVTVVGMISLLLIVSGGGKPVFGLQAEAAKKCEVTSGDNKGKTGTYTEGGSWCEGDWGGTECKDAQGNSKCKDAAKKATSNEVIVVIDGDSAKIVVTHGYYEVPQKGVVSCTTWNPLRTTSPATAICFPVVVDKLEDLATSKDEANSRTAHAITLAVRHLPTSRSR